MIAPPVFGFDLFLPGSLEQMIVKVLAVLGGAAVGGIGAGLITKVLARLATTRAVPLLPLRIVRVLGAIAVGLIVARFLWGTGGGGGGGGGGWGLFGGTGSGGAETTQLTSTTEASSRKEESPGATSKAPATPEETLRVEVLGERVQGDRWYRIEGQSKLLTLAEIQRLVEQRAKTGTPLRNLVIVVYKNSPAPDKDQVVKLREISRDLGLTPSVEEPLRDAP